MHAWPIHSRRRTPLLRPLARRATTCATHEEREADNGTPVPGEAPHEPGECRVRPRWLLVLLHAARASRLATANFPCEFRVTFASPRTAELVFVSRQPTNRGGPEESGPPPARATTRGTCRAGECAAAEQAAGQRFWKHASKSVAQQHAVSGAGSKRRGLPASRRTGSEHAG